LRKASFDKIFSTGVLQHCPDVAAAFQCRVPFLRSGGEIVIDAYEKTSGFSPLKYIARPFVRPLGVGGIYRVLSWTIPLAFELKKALYRIPAVGLRLGSLIPIGPMSHATQLQNTDEAVKHVNILTAVDMLALVYDRPKQT
jgi:hypothetical protein